MTYEMVARKLLALRYKHGLTRSELAERCYLDVGNLRKIEIGEREPRVSTFLRIIRTMDSTLKEFSQVQPVQRGIQRASARSPRRQ